MVILIRCKDIDTDSRVLKYVSFLRHNQIDYKIISWNRSEDRRFDENTINFGYRSSYNVGGWRAVKGRIKWMKFVVKTLKSLVKNDSVVIHACDLDAAFPATFFKHYYRKNIKVIFDVFDWFSSTLANQNKLITKAFGFMERFSVNYSDYVIICEKERRIQIPFEIKDEALFVLPNIPDFNKDDFLSKESNLEFNNELLTVAYVGGLYGERCLDELISLAEKGVFNLLIAGFGDQNLENRLKNSKQKNIKYFGRVPYERGLNIMYNADVIYAMYSKSNPNHLLAAPNKYYEAMFLGKPIISTVGINLEEKIVSDNIGYTTEEDIYNIEKCIKSFSRSELLIKGKNAKKIWESKYKNYIKDFLNKEYRNMISINERLD